MSSGHQTVEREVREDIGERVTHLRDLGIVENTVADLGQPGHKIGLIYEGYLVNDSIGEEECVPGLVKAGITFKAVRRPIAEFQEGKAPFYLKAQLELLMTNRPTGP